MGQVVLDSFKCLFCYPPLDQKFLIKLEFNPYSIHLRYVSLLMKLDKDVSYGRMLVE